MKRTLVIFVAFAVWWPLAAPASDHPEVWGPTGSGEFRWVSAAWAFDDEGGVSVRAPALLRKRLEVWSRDFDEQFGSARKHSLKEGQVLPPRSFCVSQEIHNRGVPEDGWLFDPAVLLSDVAVVATVKEVVLGFGPGGWPVALLALDGVLPLHSYSLHPRYVLVNVERAVIRDRVFCGDISLQGKFSPKVGARIVVIGSLGHAGVLDLAPERAGSLAAVSKDGTVTWKWSNDTGPPTLDRVQARAAELIADGLFDATATLRANHQGREAQDARTAFGRRFSDLWHRHECRDMEGAERSGGLELACKANTEP